SSSGKKSGGVGYAVKKQGDATITLVGPPSVGKSTLLNKLTNAKSKIAPYAFTTLTVIPGIMEYRDARIQILDVPGLIEGAELGKGRGKEVLSVVRGSNLLIIMCDVKRVSALKTMSELLENSGIRINKSPPKVVIEKKVRGGIQIISNIKQDMSYETIEEVAKEFRIPNAVVTITEKIDINQLIDAFSQNKVYIPAIFLVNKTDLGKNGKKSIIKLKQFTDVLRISAEKNIGLTELKKQIWKELKLIRVYLVRKKEKPNHQHPIIVKKNYTLYDVMKRIGDDFSENKNRAKIWKTGAKFPGQEVSLTTKARGGMLIRFI
ncbi:MAG: 50S ribosome-binding GTPase, partial [Candidatus Bathyarchaeota archaeon]|nr:50S ribosome-binding GTPase [Candidatus Bathyarchaeota archaeon]